MTKKRITQLELMETITGLKDIAQALREAAKGKPLEGYKEAVVAAKAMALVRHADYLEQVGEELLALIPDVPIKIPPLQ